MGLALAALPPVPAGAQRIKLPASLQELEQRARRDSNDAAAHYNVALAYWNEKRWEDAERALQVAVTIEPQFAQGYLALSRLPFARRGRLWQEIAEDRVPDDWKPAVEQSDRMYRRAFLIDPLVDLRIEGAVTPGRSVYWDLFAPGLYDLLFRGFDDIREAKYDKAYERLNALAVMFGGRHGVDSLPASILWYRGLAAAHIGQYDSATADFRRLLARSEARERRDSLIHVPLATNEYRYVLAVVTHRAGRVEEAVPLYQEALAVDLGLYMAHTRLAEILEASRQFAAAVPSRRRAVAANPDDPSLLLDLGLTLGKAGQWAEAAAMLEHAMEANPRDARAPYYLGIVQQQLGKPTEARASFERFLALAPSRYERQLADARQRLATLR
jgi:tetratricopeptide (TPR) repeat protein